MIRNYISMEICSFWWPYLKGWAIFNFFDPSGAPKGSKNIVCKNKRHNQIFHAKLRYLCKI